MSWQWQNFVPNQMQMQAMQGMQMPPNYPWNQTVPQQSQQQMQQTQGVQQVFDFIPVNGYEDVRSFYMKPNQRVWFRFQNEPVIALKFSDAVGSSDTKYFRIYEFDPGQEEYNDKFEGRFSGIEQKIASIEERLTNLGKVGMANEPAEQVSTTDTAASPTSTRAGKSSNK